MILLIKIKIEFWATFSFIEKVIFELKDKKTVVEKDEKKKFKKVLNFGHIAHAYEGTLKFQKLNMRAVILV